MIIADENLEQYWINFLRNNGFNVFSIREHHAGMTRYDQPLYHTVEEQLLKATRLYYEVDSAAFITVTEKKIRVRRL